MKTIFSFLLVFLVQGIYAQETKTVTYRQWQDMPQDTYVRIMHTADSLLAEYKSEPFNFEKKDGSCCFKGLMIIKEFYQRALIESPGDEDAITHAEEVTQMIEDEKLLFEEKQFALIANRGDFYFEQGYYKKSLVFYERAYELSSKSKEIKKKLKAAKKMAKKYENI